ncbi:hypothetical protein J4E81_009074 [Alternaria sp. BMP 2799]|nr:hypothetical protein J4E81_009074 [Alternaria sp. BMP 2799]
MGWFGDSFGADKSGRWPKHPDNSGKTDIAYCYENKAAKDELEGVIAEGWGAWQRSLGRWGKESGHSLLFTRRLVPGQDIYCYLADGDWNQLFPADTVVIKRGAPGGWAAASSLGYRSEGSPGRHQLSIGNAEQAPNRDLAWVVAHELGHIFGLMHEHSRGDRDDHVQFNCASLTGYHEALQKATADGFTINELCNIFNVAKHYQFDASEYYKWTNDGLTYSAEYDYDSIMHYSSWQSHNPALVNQDQNNPDNYPLVRLTGGKNGQKSLLPLPRPSGEWGISRLDKEAIKLLYPWE